MDRYGNRVDRDDHSREVRDRGYDQRYGFGYRPFERSNDRSIQRDFDQGYDQNFGRSGYGYDSFHREGEGIRGYGGDYPMPDTPRSYGRRNDTGYGVYQWDRVRQGEHFGKGPRGYQRSNERIFEEVCEALTYDSELDASQIEVHVDSGEVTLTGQVPDRHSKRRAEQIADAIRGVVDVHNQLKVDRSHTHPARQKDQASRQQPGVQH